MQKIFDNGRPIDWGKTSEDYAKYRPGPPDSFYKAILPFQIGINNQKILDQGTGTGVVARRFSQQGCEVYGTDISENQIAQAKKLAAAQKLTTKFSIAPAEIQAFADNSFDVICASQCMQYFDKSKWIPEVKRLLKPNGQLLITFFAWVPTEDEISRSSEELVLKHNADWGSHSWDGKVPQNSEWAEGHFKQKALIIYDENIDFTLDIWCGRMRALRGIGASLSPDEVNTFDQEHRKTLQERFGDSFVIPHRIVSRIFTIV